MRTFKKSKSDELAKEFKRLEEKNKLKRRQHNHDFDRLKKESQDHHKQINDRLDKFIPSRNK